jgi:hypothetical protein
MMVVYDMMVVYWLFVAVTCNTFADRYGLLSICDIKIVILWFLDYYFDDICDIYTVIL